MDDNTLNEQQAKSHLRRIANMLLINGGFSDNPGLYSGDTGIVLFFFQHFLFLSNLLAK